MLRKLFNQVNPLDRFQKFSATAEDEGVGSGQVCLRDEVERLLAEVRAEGLEAFYSPFFTECGRWMDLPRKYELLAVLSRLRLDEPNN